MRIKNEEKHNGSSGKLTTPSKRVSEKRFARIKASTNVYPSDSEPSSVCPLPTTSTCVSSPSLYASLTGSVPTLNSPPNCSRALLAHSSHSLSAISKLETNGESRDTTISVAPSSIFNSPSSTFRPVPEKGKVNSPSSELFFVDNTTIGVAIT